MSHLDGKPTERLICATCVQRLRDALAFKKQVLQCEEAFVRVKMYDAEMKGIYKSKPNGIFLFFCLFINYLHTFTFYRVGRGSCLQRGEAYDSALPHYQRQGIKY